MLHSSVDTLRMRQEITQAVRTVVQKFCPNTAIRFDNETLEVENLVPIGQSMTVRLHIIVNPLDKKETAE